MSWFHTGDNKKYTLAGNTAGKSGVAAETVELVQFPWCVLSYSGLGLLSLHSL